MQKLAKRTVQAQRQAGRKAQAAAKKQAANTRKQNSQYMQMASKEIRENLRDARRARREDWELGPLAPKRDLGFNGYGAFKENMRQDWGNSGMNKLRPHILEQRCAWAGGSTQLNLAEGDRVVILDGPDKGKLDRIKSIDTENGTVTLETHHKALFSTWMQGQVSAAPMPLSVSSIRLVYPITNPETGITRDVIINQLKAVPPNMQSESMSYDRWEYGRKWDRLAPGINVVIPWPEVEAPKYETWDADTTREIVEGRSFYYNLLSSPMPPSVIDELRNKFSKFRTRHEPWYIAEKEAEEARKKGGHALLQSMQTPLEEFHAKQKQLKDARGEPELTDDMLEKLGEIIAKTKTASLEDAGVSEVTASQAAPKGN